MKTVVISAADSEGNPCSIDDAQKYRFEVLTFDQGEGRNELIDADQDELEAEIQLILGRYGEIGWGFQSIEGGELLQFGPQLPNGDGASPDDLADMLMEEAVDIADDEDLDTTDDIAFDGILRMALIEASESALEVRGP